MEQVTIRAVTRPDLPLLDQALRALSQDLGDPHQADLVLLEKTGFGPSPAYFALIAQTPASTLCGAIVFSPVLSTTRGAAGLYVSDLWVAKAVRGMGLGPRLMAHAADFAETHWGAAFLKLAVYDKAPDARRFYDRLGFTPNSSEMTLFLDNSGFAALKGHA